MEILPRHIAIIMDGNGRWAKKKKLPRIMGHRQGVKTAQKTVKLCSEIGIKALTLYTFSSENWKRPRREVNALMNLLAQAIDKYLEEARKSDIRINVIGRLEGLPDVLRNRIGKIVEESASKGGMVVTLALNYGARQEILDAVKAVCKKVREENMDISSWEDKDFEEFLYTKGLPDPDLVIRTSGEMRISNFLLWQTAYSEFYFTDVLWPDFNAKELKKALAEYAARERRFGG